MDLDRRGSLKSLISSSQNCFAIKEADMERELATRDCSSGSLPRAAWSLPADLSIMPPGM